jgi:hypothetical protein
MLQANEKWTKGRGVIRRLEAVSVSSWSRVLS